MPLLYPSRLTSFVIFNYPLPTIMRNFYFVAVWLNKSGSASALCQEHAKDPLAVTTDKSSIVNSTIHTFKLELVERFLGITPDDLTGTDTKNKLDLSNGQIPGVDAEKALGMKLRIQTLEAVGEEEALKLGILNRDRTTGHVVISDGAQKRDRNTKEHVYVNGVPVYRKTILRADDAERYPNVLVRTAVMPAVVRTNVLEDSAGSADEDNPEIF